MISHQDMRAALRDAFRNVIGREATLPELQCLQAIASLESGYGQYWKPPGDGSFNLGAIQKGSGWNGDTFAYTDTHPNADGTSTPYRIAFRKYKSLVAGAEDLVRVVYVNLKRGEKVLPRASAGDTLGFSAGLYETGYYEGFGKDGPDPGTSPREERIANHHKSVVASIRAQALALDEPLPADIEAMPIKPELLRLGSKGSAVVSLQEQLNRHGVTPKLNVDGDFGGQTHRNVIAFQRRAHLVADGIVGTRTWDELTKALA